MGRRKIIMDYITDDRKRMSTFEKRRIGLFKKARELSKLCGVSINVNIKNRKSLYQFTNSQKDDFSNTKQDLKIEENFNNESFEEYLAKKAQIPKISAESSSNEYTSVCQDQVCLNSDDEEDRVFFKVLQERKVLDSFIKIQHKDINKNDSKNGAIFDYKPSSSMCAELRPQTTGEDKPQTISYMPSLQSLDGYSNSNSSELRNPCNYKNTDCLGDYVYFNDLPSFDNIITTMRSDPSLFSNHSWDSQRLSQPGALNYQYFSGQSNF